MKALVYAYKNRHLLYSPHAKPTSRINVIRFVFLVPTYVDSNGILDIFKVRKGQSPFLSLNISKTPLESICFGVSKTRPDHINRTSTLGMGEEVYIINGGWRLLRN